MIESFFVWLLGPNLAVMFLISLILIGIIGFCLLIEFGSDIFDWIKKENRK